jgi:hypothetical protein
MSVTKTKPKSLERNLERKRESNRERLDSILERYHTLVAGWEGSHSDYRDDNRFKRRRSVGCKDQTTSQERELELSRLQPDDCQG